MSNHSIIEHRANYHFLKVEEDYLAICSYGEHSPHCKALILAILEHWMNAKRESEQEWIYLTLPEWIEQTYECYARNVLIDCLKELLDSKLIKRRDIRRFEQNTYEYTLNIEEIQKRIRALPEKAPKDIRPNLDAWRTLQRQKKEERKAKKVEEPEEEEGSLKINGGVGEKSTALKSKRRVGEKSTALRSGGSLKTNDPPLKSKRNLDTILDSSLTSLTEIQGDDVAVATATPPFSPIVEHVQATELPPKPTRRRKTDESGDTLHDTGSDGTSSYPTGDDPSRVGGNTGNAANRAHSAVRTSPDDAARTEQASQNGKVTPRRTRAAAAPPVAPPDPLATAPPAVRAIVAEWQGCFKKLVPATATMVAQATALLSWQPVPGEIAECRKWMYQTDRNNWYREHGMDLGSVGRDIGRFRSRADAPPVEAPSAPPSPESVRTLGPAYQRFVAPPPLPPVTAAPPPAGTPQSLLELLGASR